MLRNGATCTGRVLVGHILNEVLSLNAQEFLKEIGVADVVHGLLNEVLSLNAQESGEAGFGEFRAVESSMKS